MSKTTKTPVRNLQRLLRLHDDALETHRRWSISRAGRYLKIDMQQVDKRTLEVPDMSLGGF